MSVLVYDCGSVENTVTAILDTESGAMIIRGNGDVDNYMNEYSPWYSEHSDILQVTIDKGITRIGSGTFYGCENLSFVEIASTVTSIGADVFQNCTSLTSIKIPKSITEIGNGTFTDSGLTEVKFYGNPPTVGTDIFDGVNADVYTPEGNEEWTETAKGTVAGNGSNLTWKTFDSKPNLIEYDELDYLWSKIKKYVDNNVSVTPVLTSGTKIATITVNGVDTDLYSSPFSGTVGNKLKPIYINNGVPTECDDLKYPDGEILNLNAKGLTTSSIAEVNGVIDSSGYDNHGQAFGGVSVVNDSKTGQCYSFDGVDDYLETIENVDITQEITYSFWINVANFTSQSYNCIIWHASISGTITGIDLYLLNSGLFRFQNRNPDINTYSINPISVNTWYHIVITANATETKIYINSTLDCSNNHGITEHLNTYKLRIGQAVGNWFTNCKILNFRIYPRVLSFTEIKTLYILGSKSTYTGVAYHAATATTATTASACSGNSATATTASKLSNTSAIGNTATPVYFTNGGVPSACTRNFLTAGGTKITTAGWYRVLNLPACITGIVTISKGYNIGEPRFISFFVDNNFSSSKPNARVIATTNSGGNYLTKVRIIWKYDTTCYFEIYVTPTTEIWMMMFIPLSGNYTASAVNFTAGAIPDNYTAYEFAVPNTAGIAPIAGVRSTGSASKPVYVDANGVVQACTSVDLNAATATTATNTNNAKLTHTVGNTEYPLVFGTSFVITDAQQALRIGTPTATAANCALRCKSYCAAANTQGEAYLVCGNNIAKASANNARGSIYLYGTNAYNTRIVPSDTSASITVTLPNATGTIALTSSNITGSSASCTGNAATATTATNANNLKVNHTGAAWRAILAVGDGFTSASNQAVYGINNGSVSYYVDANATSGNQRAILRLGNAIDNTTAAGHSGQIYLYGTSTGLTVIAPGYNSTGTLTVYTPSIAGYIPVSSDNTIRNIVKVSALPSSPNANTLYIVA